MKIIESEIAYKHYFGSETYGEIRKENDKFQCYETPLYGGEFMKVGEYFKELEQAIKFLHQLT